MHNNCSNRVAMRRSHSTESKAAHALYLLIAQQQSSHDGLLAALLLERLELSSQLVRDPAALSHPEIHRHMSVT
jgi:hypothetical protein